MTLGDVTMYNEEKYDFRALGKAIKMCIRDSDGSLYTNTAVCGVFLFWETEKRELC